MSQAGVGIGGTLALDRDNTFVGDNTFAGSIGYGPAGNTPPVGAAVTQQTNRTTGVTINALCGTITTNNASLAAEAVAAFVVTNPKVAIGDVVVVAQQSGQVGGMTDVVVTAVANGSFTVSVMNNNVAAGTAETGAIKINFAIIKAVSN